MFSKLINLISKQETDYSHQEDKSRYLSMPLDERRKQYTCKDNYKTLADIQTWRQYCTGGDSDNRQTVDTSDDLSDKISVFVGNITTLEIDAIVNAANDLLCGGAGVDGAIHAAADRDMLQCECRSIRGCPPGSSKITGGYKLPAKYIIHTVGPIGENPDLLKSCYKTSLNLMAESGLKSIAFPYISSGAYGYPNEVAAQIAIGTVRQWLESSPYAKHTDRIVFCLFEQKDVEIYNRLMSAYFPINKL